MDFIWNFLRNFEQASFWLGFAVGSLLWWLIRLVRPRLKAMREAFQKQMRVFREGTTNEGQFRYRNDIMQLAQRMHLASSLFSLDEIIITPRVLGPPPPMEPEAEIQPADIVNQTIPYMPDWPDLASFYNAPNFTLSQIMSQGSSVALIGNSGSGKTVALADLAIQVARATPHAGHLAKDLPVHIHIADLPFRSPDPDDLVGPIHKVLAGKVKRKTQSKLAATLQDAFDSQEVLFLVDGIDEMAPADVDLATDYLAVFRQVYPDIQIAAAVSSEYYGGITALGLTPVVLKTWNREEKFEFLQKWGDLWLQFINPSPWSTNGKGTSEQSRDVFDSLILNSWVASDLSSANPLEFTLKTWSAYAGDALGTKNVEALDALVRRLTVNIRNAGSGLEQLALQMTLKMSSLVDMAEARKWMRTLDDRNLDFDSLDDEDPVELEDLSDRDDKRGGVGRQIFDQLLEQGLLAVTADEKVRFSHPVIFGYFAGRGLAASGGYQSVLNQPDWAGKGLALHYLASHSDISEITKRLIENDTLLHGRLFSVAEWLRDAPKENIRWRINLMRSLVTTLQSDQLPAGIRARCLGALISSGDAGVAELCRKLVSSTDPYVRQMATLGLGYYNDIKSVSFIEGLVQDHNGGVQRAACLALAAIGSQQAVDAVATALLQGEEDLQRAAAESLANHPAEGHDLLREAGILDDLLVRRAAVFGLGRVRAKWSEDLLRTIQTEDDQWLVRTAASQVLDEIDGESPFIPTPIRELHDLPWLIQLAADFDQGISPGEGAREMLLRALQAGQDSQKLAALDYYYRLGADDSIFPTIYELYLMKRGQIQDGAHNTLWHLRATGLEFPSPDRFGFR
jgi:hypothetical protein